MKPKEEFRYKAEHFNSWVDCECGGGENSHDLACPLTVVAGRANNLLDEYKKALKRVYLQKWYNGSNVIGASQAGNHEETALLWDERPVEKP